MRKNLLLVSLIAAAMSLGVVGCNKPKPATSSAETPSQTPSENPSENPSEEPSENPSEEPSENPSEEPSENPSEDPSEDPSENPSEEPSESSEEPSESSEDPSETHTYGVSVDNKTSLTEEWHVGDAGRTLSLTITIDGEEGNAQQAINKGELTIESSNSQIVAVQGKVITPVAAGEATITVNYHDASDTFDVTVLAKEGAKVKYGTEHDGTLEDPFSNEDALIVAKHADYNNEDFYVGGTIASFYHAPGSRNDGAVSWFLTPAQEGGEKFEVYQCFGPNNTPLTDDDVWVGGYAIAHGTFTSYNGQYETSAGSVFVSCEGNKPNPRQTVEKTFAEALAGVKALDDGADTYDYWKVNAYVTKKSGANFFLTATQGETLDDADAEKANAIELYNVTDADALALLTKDANINITMVMKNYHSQVENLLAVTADQIEVVNAGGTWDVIPEPAVEDRTLAAFIAGENTAAKAYNVTAEIKAFKDGATKDAYGNMTLTDGANDLVIYGSTMTASALAWNNSDAYEFKNPQDFMTNAESNALNVGDTITMKLIRADYKGTVQGKGVITNIVPPTPLEPESLALDTEDFALVPGGSKDITATISPNGATGDILWTVDPADAGVTVTDGHVDVEDGTAPDTYTITATVDGYPLATASVTLTVSAAAIPAESVELDHDSLEFVYPAAVSTAQLTASVLPANQTDTAVWESSDEDVATVSSSGLVTVVGAGTATITVTYGSVSDTCTVTVSELSFATLTNGATITDRLATVIGVDGKNVFVDDGTAGVLAFCSSAPSVSVGDAVKVSGTVSVYNKGLQIGSATVTSTAETAPAVTTTVTPLDEATASNYFTNGTVPGTKFSMTTDVVAGNATFPTWKLGAVEFERAKYSPVALELGYKYNVEGYLQGTYNNQYLMMVVTSATKIEGKLSLVASSTSAAIDEQITLTATSENVTGETYEWSVDDDTLGSLLDSSTGSNTLTALAAGTVKVTVTNSLGYSASVSITITDGSGGGETPAGTVLYTLDGTQAGTGNAYAGDGTATQGGITWTINGNLTTNPWRIGGKSITDTNRIAYSGSAVSAEDFSKITIEVGSMSSITINSITVKVGTTAQGDDLATLTKTSGFTANSTLEFSKEDSASWANAYVTVVFNVTVSATSNKFVELKSIKVVK